jgi:MoaA/NifB/PqqE/SkfB family radical SAM enzyme
MKVRIVNCGRGFATNSSGVHYPIFGVESPPKDYRRWSPWYDPEKDLYCFGQTPEILASAAAKRRYLAATAYEGVPQSAQPTLGIEIARLVDPKFDGLGFVHVDHEGLMDLPWTWRDPGAPDRDFLEAMCAFFDRSDVVMAIGGDNDESGRPPNVDGGTEWRGPRTDHDPNRPAARRPVARRESDHVWTIFDRTRGNRLTIAFGDYEAPDRYPAPMLMDVKITDRCPFGCAHCYQGSAPHGLHARLPVVRRLAAEAAGMKVFEVALGGGEPTGHPHFIGALKLFRARGIVPNFTTFAADWLRDRRKRDRILYYCGAFAYSLDTRRAEEDLREFAALLNDEGREKATIHLVAGTLPPKEIVQLVRLARELAIPGVTLLGYKATGRAAIDPPHPYSDGSWIAELIASPRHQLPYRMGIDTLLAAQMESVLREYDQPSWLYSTREGDVSMYVDLVGRKAGPSSYHLEQMIDHVDLRSSWDAIQVVDNADGERSEAINT